MKCKCNRNKNNKIMKVIYTSKEINPNFYMVLGVDDNRPVLYVYKDNELFDWHFSEGSSFMNEMSNTIECYKTVHGLEPSIEDLLTWRKWFSTIFHQLNHSYD